MSKNERPKLGTWHIITGVAMKKKERINYHDWYGRVKSNWFALETAPRCAMYIGTRTVHDNTYEWERGEGDGHKRGEYHEVWLFVVDSRHNPVYVFPEQAQFIGEPNE